MMSLDHLQKTIHNPAIPYTGSILGGLLPGELVVIIGSVPEDSDRFQVDFQCGSSTQPRADVAFHFNPRFKRSGHIVCNTLKEERWGWEEITYEMPFQKGKPFEIVFMVLKNKFQVSVNKKHLLLYKHRINLERIDTLGIYGKVQIETIGFVSQNGEVPDGSKLASLAATTRKYMCLGLICDNFVIDSMASRDYGGDLVWSPVKHRPKKFAKIIYRAGLLGKHPKKLNIVVPYIAKLKSALCPGWTAVIKGEVNKNPNSFTVNLKSSDSKDIALHLNPRMKTNVFVRNSFLYDSWGEEEKDVVNFPFSPGMYFELLIFCDVHQYKVAVNGIHILEYKHRFKQLGKINMLEVMGDIELLDVRSWQHHTHISKNSSTAVAFSSSTNRC